MKFIGLCLIVLCFSLIGLKMNIELRQKVQLLESSLFLLQDIRRELLLTQASSQRILAQLQHKRHDPVLDTCLQRCRETSFPEAWSKTVETAFQTLNTEQRSPISAVGAILGSGDLRHQEEALLQCEEQLRVILSEEKEKSRTHGTLYSNLGFLSGLLTAVILL